MPIQFPIAYDTASLKPHAEKLAEQFHFYIDNHRLPRLQLREAGLCFLSKEFSPITIGFQAMTKHRRQQSAKKQALFRACKPTLALDVLDVTAGWGKDAALLASWGCRVRMLERHPVMAALLQDALIRTPDSWNLSLFYTEATAYLEQLAERDYPEVIYLDPMHPARQKSALVKKEMQLLQELIGPDVDAMNLLQCAIEHARLRVVMKWPHHLPPLLKPGHSIDGNTVRFDVYSPQYKGIEPYIST